MTSGDRESAPKPISFQLGRLNCSTHSIGQLMETIRELLHDKTLPNRSILCINAHIYNAACSDPQLRRILDETAIVTADGMSIVWAARLFGTRIPSRCNMTEAFRAFMADKRMPETKAFVIGLHPEGGQLAAKAIEATCAHCKILGTASGYLAEAEYRDLFAGLGPDVDFILLGMGTPKTEHVSMLAREMCPGAVVWGVGGGTLRILAGLIPEAPAFFRRSGLQWVYRLWAEPRALLGRYMLGNPLFVLRVLYARLLIGRP